MDGCNGWHVIRGAAAGAEACDRAGAQDKTIINRILHRFRPIAPKPATGTDLDSSSSVIDIKKLLASKTFRRKRKYVRTCKSNKLKKSKRVPGVPSSDQEKEGEGEGEREDLSSSVTLQLLPEGSESKDGESLERIGKTRYNNDNFQDLAADKMKEYVDDQEKHEHLMCLKFKLKQPMFEGFGKPDQMLVMLPQKRESTVVESWVTVECVTDIYSTCMDERAVLLGCTDVERMRHLEEDTCPGFISDGLNHVQWMNGAYKKMVEMATKEDSKERAQLCNTAPEVMVRLVIKEKLLRFVDRASAFSCRARLQNSWQKEKCSQTVVPCDVWRMDFGGFAWRLDVDSALSLGR
ncbi:hypothetical protein SADUNF_Sadunf16G0212700 [Salix dunnii]|uniref:DUF7950 domain-containing protein n=1 Tax=Salix dunnii TaxID=1413687 RepID=A0A835MMD5_9ROSI|nr:hypothetical protein SADUNF_Sadunf16G0212700 [Salix dunnii]